MAVFTNAHDLARHQRLRARRVQRSLQVTQAEVVAEIKQKARQLVSGTVSSRELARLGHPFARRSRTAGGRGRARGSLARLPINVQSGQLRESLRVFRRARAGGTAFQLQFTSPHAIVLLPGGTRQMVARGFWTALNAFARPRLLARHKAAKRQAEAS